MTSPYTETDRRETEPITLKEACESVLGNRVKAATLRAEAQRGNLLIFRVGRRDFTTRSAVREMVRRCQDAARHRASTSIQDGNSGSSETARASSARAALKQTVEALKTGLPRISPKSTRRSAARAH